MGADNHPTVEVETDDRATLAARLASDLRDISRVTSAEPNVHVDGIVSFEVSSSGMPPEVMGVLGDHRATLTGICLEADASLQEAHAHVPRSD
jgi:hypothetical protein